MARFTAYHILEMSGTVWEALSFFPTFEEQEKELLISDEQSSTCLMLAASLICKSDYSDIKQLMNKRVGNLLVNCNTKGLDNNLVQLR